MFLDCDLERSKAEIKYKLLLVKLQNAICDNLTV